MRKNTNLTLDYEFILELKRRRENISLLVNNFLRSYLNIPKEKRDDDYHHLSQEIEKDRAALLYKEQKIAKLEKEEKKKYKVVIEGGL